MLPRLLLLTTHRGLHSQVRRRLPLAICFNLSRGPLAICFNHHQLLDFSQALRAICSSLRLLLLLLHSNPLLLLLLICSSPNNLLNNLLSNPAFKCPLLLLLLLLLPLIRFKHSNLPSNQDVLEFLLQVLLLLICFNHSSRLLRRCFKPRLLRLHSLNRLHLALHSKILNNI